jgi:hypothetical protein
MEPNSSNNLYDMIYINDGVKNSNQSSVSHVLKVTVHEVKRLNC